MYVFIPVLNVIYSILFSKNPKQTTHTPFNIFFCDRRRWHGRCMRRALLLKLKKMCSTKQPNHKDKHDFLEPEITQ